MINPKMQKYKNLKISLKGNGFEIEKSYDNNYQIVVKSPCGDLVDFYSSTGSFSFRKERVRGKGLTMLISTLNDRRDNINRGFASGGYVKSPKNIEIAGNVTKDRAHKIAMVNVTGAHDSSEFQRLMRVLDDADSEKEGDSFMDSISKAMSKIREAKPQNFLERIAMNYLRKRHYKIID